MHCNYLETSSTVDPTPRISDGISKGSISRFENSELSISRFENSLVIIIFLKYDAHAALRLINLESLWVRPRH